VVAGEKEENGKKEWRYSDPQKVGEKEKKAREKGKLIEK